MLIQKPSGETGIFIQLGGSSSLKWADPEIGRRPPKTTPTHSDTLPLTRLHLLIVPLPMGQAYSNHHTQGYFHWGFGWLFFGIWIPSLKTCLSIYTWALLFCLLYPHSNRHRKGGLLKIILPLHGDIFSQHSKAKM